MGLTYASMLIVTGFAWFWFYGLVRLVRDIALIGNAVTLVMLGILAYLFGLMHGLDADHLAAIDNSTRKLVQERKRSLFTGIMNKFSRDLFKINN
jgi:high-affinity nickel-transport protein